MHALKTSSKQDLDSHNILVLQIHDACMIQIQLRQLSIFFYTDGSFLGNTSFEHYVIFEVDSDLSVKAWFHKWMKYLKDYTLLLFFRE